MNSNRIGFEKSPSDWEGPLTLQCRLDEGYESTRYIAELASQKLVYYPPLRLLGIKSPSEAPALILITIGKARHARGDVKFKSEIRSDNGSSEHLVYEFYDQKVNSVRYETKDVKGNTSLYIPNEVFKGLKHPKRVFLAISMPQNGE
jgi:hypothetical protein